MNQKLALVTGGCRRVGGAISARLAQAGWSLALHGHTDTAPEESLQAAMKRHSTHWEGFVADLSDDGACSDLMERTKTAFGRAPDLLVNSASMFEYDDASSLSVEALDAHFRLNLFAPVLLTRALVDSCQGEKQPAVVQITDQRVRNPNGDYLSYILSKQALAASVRTLAQAYGARARINGVAPGLTLETDEYAPDQLERLQDMMPLERMSRPSDIAEAVLYLANAQAVSGDMVYVDGGAHLQSYARDFLFLGK